MEAPPQKKNPKQINKQNNNNKKASPARNLLNIIGVSI